MTPCQGCFCIDEAQERGTPCPGAVQKWQNQVLTSSPSDPEPTPFPWLHSAPEWSSLGSLLWKTRKKKNLFYKENHLLEHFFFPLSSIPVAQVPLPSLMLPPSERKVTDRWRKKCAGVSVTLITRSGVFVVSTKLARWNKSVHAWGNCVHRL